MLTKASNDPTKGEKDPYYKAETDSKEPNPAPPTPAPAPVEPVVEEDE